MYPYPPPISAGRTVVHPSFAQLQLPAQAVIIEVWADEHAELDNGLLLPVAELSPVDTGEEWRLIKEYETYLISSHGKIVSLRYHRKSRQRLMRVLKPKSLPSIILSKNTSRKQSGINRLVAQNFLPVPETRMTMVIPLDGNHLNVRADNLRWVDPHEKEDASVVGYLHCCGARSPLSKLTPDKIRLIQQRVAAGHSHQSIADAMGVSRPTISMIAAGKAWYLAQQALVANPVE